MKETVADCIQGWAGAATQQDNTVVEGMDLNQGFGVQPLPPPSLCLSFPIQNEIRTSSFPQDWIED